MSSADKVARNCGVFRANATFRLLDKFFAVECLNTLEGGARRVEIFVEPPISTDLEEKATKSLECFKQAISLFSQETFCCETETELIEIGEEKITKISIIKNDKNLKPRFKDNE